MLKKVLVFLMGVLSVMYLLNIGMGVFELIPDTFPIIGNLDEAGAVFLLIMCLRYFGIDLTRIFDKDDELKKLDD